MAMKFDEAQLGAIGAAVDGRFTIINGGAGSGKTTIIKGVVDELTRRGDGRVRLCAFAGKAAARLKEATGYGASTIHRMLMYMGPELGFTLKSLAGESVILDEASMVSSDLMAEIIRRKPKRLVLVGDEAQLPPVGSGQPFHDLISLRPDMVRTLTTCYRNNEAIYRAALAIRRGDTPVGYEKTEGETWQIAGTGGAEATHEAILSGIKESGSIDFDQDVILCPRNGESLAQKCAVESLNSDIKDIVNPAVGNERLSVGDRVINTKNMSDLDIWNGTTGRVKAIDAAGAMWLTLDYPILDFARSSPDNPVYISEVLVPKNSVRHLQLAYALTVHKAQGSQYRRVFFVTLARDAMALLDRSMIYTGVTRAREACTVLGEARALYDGIRTVKSKNTVLRELARESA